MDLTRFKTPDPWNHFYAREALGVRTFDLYDQVIGAFGRQLQRILAMGGSDDAGPAEGARANRFKPVVRYVGPVSYTHLRAHETVLDLVCRLLLEKKKKKIKKIKKKTRKKKKKQDRREQRANRSDRTETYREGSCHESA